MLGTTEFDPSEDSNDSSVLTFQVRSDKSNTTEKEFTRLIAYLSRANHPCLERAINTLIDHPHQHVEVIGDLLFSQCLGNEADDQNKFPLLFLSWFYSSCFKVIDDELLIREPGECIGRRHTALYLLKMGAIIQATRVTSWGGCSNPAEARKKMMCAFTQSRLFQFVNAAHKHFLLAYNKKAPQRVAFMLIPWEIYQSVKFKFYEVITRGSFPIGAIKLKISLGKFRRRKL